MTVQSAKQFCSMIEAVRERSGKLMPFWRELSFAEQRLLNPDEAVAYQDWIMSRPFKRRTDINSETYVDGDYDMIASRRRYETGE